ncbi:MAG TPA: hypothetical protein VHQ47_20820 [Phycisphaerae bacterium]|nr:hypothetical protein [Phycisphaerae bacterium]
MASSAKLKAYPEIQAIKDRLAGGKGSELVIAFIPSHDKDDHARTDQDHWAQKALTLFGRMYEGATAFEQLKGIYHSKDMQKKGLRPCYDTPIMVQSLADAADVENEDNLLALAAFLRDMGTTMNQYAVGLVVNNKYINIVIAPV